MTRPQVALATFTGFPALYDDDRLALGPLAEAGLEATAAVWDDPAVDWSSYDLVVVRSTWDYTLRREEFLRWAQSVPRLANPAAVLRWNTDKRYLAELAAAGVPVVPTVFVGPGETYDVPAYEHVVKPTVSAGARDTRRFAAGEDSTAHAHSLLATGRTVMVQPYQAAVDEAGETALLFFAGEHSHAARKAAVLVPSLDDPNHVEISARQATPAELAVAQAALAEVPWPEPLLYARVDLVPGPDGAPVLMELEVSEPSMFLRQSAGAAERFAAAVQAHLARPLLR
jgi:glutathione synthase/RimK-type ligase-like ATP-grasp enzyme